MKRVEWKVLASRTWVVLAIVLLIGNSIYKYGEIRLSPAEVQVRKVELGMRLGFPRTALFLLESGRWRNYDEAQRERLKDAEEHINASLMEEREDHNQTEGQDYPKQ